MQDVKEYIKCIEELNNDLGVVGKNSYIYEGINEIEVGIQAPNNTVSTTILDKETLISEIEKNTWKDFVIDAYLTALRYFDIIGEVQEANNNVLNQNDITPSQKIYMIENDIEYFKEKLYVKKYVLNSL